MAQGEEPKKPELTKRQLEQKATVAAYQKLLARPEAELVLNDLSKECYENVLTFVKDDPYGSAFNSGKRYVILHIRKLMEKKQEKPRQENAK